MPSSPPNRPSKINARETTNSMTPSVIMAKAVPPRRVDTLPNRMPKKRPPSPPTSGSSATGNTSPLSIQRSTWMAV
jgi:hypothetical protein